MKPTFSSIALVSLACLQYLAGTTTAQVTTTTTTTASSASAGNPSSTGPAVVPTPTVPAWVNTPGLVVSSVFDGMVVSQNSFLSISTRLRDQRPMNSILITVAKKDGSGNTTIADIKEANLVDSNQLWNATATSFPAGPYVLNMIVTAGTANATGTTGAVPQPSTGATPPPAAGGAPSIFYWKANVVVREPPVPGPGTNGAVSGRIGSIAGYAVAAGVALVGSLLVL